VHNFRFEVLLLFEVIVALFLRDWVLVVIAKHLVLTPDVGRHVSGRRELLPIRWQLTRYDVILLLSVHIAF
jgi:hypothetical protein